MPIKKKIQTKKYVEYNDNKYQNYYSYDIINLEGTFKTEHAMTLINQIQATKLYILLILFICKVISRMIILTQNMIER